MNVLSNAIQVLQSHCVNQPRCATCQFSQNGDKCKLTVHNVDNDGYRVFCPSCGEEIMLCDACLHADDNLGGKCDFKTDFDGNPTCFRRREHNNKINN